MGSIATINARLPEALKLGGGKVLEREGVSPTALVRSVYRYMDRHQEIPACLDVAPQASPDAYERRRALLRSFDGFAATPDHLDCGEERARRIREKYGDLL